MLLLVAVLLPVLLGLGFWQLERGSQKRALEAAFLDALSSLPVAPGDDPEDFRRIRLTGRYEQGHDFLIDNQVRSGRLGFAVVSVFRTDDGRRWLVDRGFLPTDDPRGSLPELGTPSGLVSVVGVVWPDLGLLPLFADEQWPDGWPKRIPRLNVNRMAGILEDGVAREVRLERGQPGVLEAPLLVMRFGAERHLGYAVQWFGLALVLALGFVIHGLKRGD